jgi:hypothetical protein
MNINGTLYEKSYILVFTKSYTLVYMKDTL